MSFLEWWENFWHQSTDEEEYNESNLYETVESISDEPEVTSDSLTHEPGLIEWFFGWGKQSNGDTH